MGRKNQRTVFVGSVDTYMIAAAVADQAFSGTRLSPALTLWLVASLAPATAASAPATPAVGPAPVASAPAPASPPPAAGPPVDFAGQILPIFERACVSCHGPKKAQGGLQLTSARRLMKGGIGDNLIVPGKADQSYLVQRLLGQGGEDRMPLKKDPLPDAEVELIRRWIDQGAPLPPEPPPRFVPAPGGLKRLTTAQYHNTLRDLFGERIELPTHLEPDTLVAGSATVGAARIGLSEHGVEKFSRAAHQLAGAALRDPAFVERFVPCPLGATEDATTTFPAPCARGFIERFGRRAWRRPLQLEETNRYERLARGVAESGRGLSGGLAAVTSAMLQSPHFLYRSEIGVPDPKDPTRLRLTDYEMASRLAYFLWGAPPDDQLLDAAGSGRLSTPEGLAAETERMLRSPRARETMAAFFVELFRLRRLDRLYEGRGKHPKFTTTVSQSMRGETLRVIEEVAFDPKRDFREIFSARFTYVNGELARLYGLPEPAEGSRYTRVELPAGNPRTGVLGQASFLSIFAHNNSSSPTRRGKFIREALLCQAVPPPPPSVDTKLPKDEGGVVRTVRQKLEAHRKNPRCNGCHKAMDPLGLAFESFDNLGIQRMQEAGLPIDTSGELDGTAFQTPAELGALLAKNTKIGACVARSLFRYALGSLESEGEEPLLEELARGLERDGYRFPALVTSVIKSEGFRYLSKPSETTTAQLQ
jgi:mono/diheme cytochrome c family protein